MQATSEATGLYGLMAEFDSAQGIVDASTKAVAAGYTRLEAYTPIPIEELNDIIHKKRTVLPKLVLTAAFAGMATGFALQYWASAIEYPLNVGGRPLISWPSFIPITFELTILMAAFGAVFGMFALNGLPQPYHPVFNSPRFELASRTHFFLCIEAKDPKYDPAETRRFLESLGANEVTDVEN